MNIDWSKAPEGCLEIGKNQWDELAWLCVDGYIYLHCNGCMVNWATPRALKRSDFHVFDIRPEEEWTGEGLPPVGTVCEVCNCTHEYAKQFNGQKVEIVAHHMRGSIAVAVFAGDDLRYHGVVAGYFRPIRTPEQIAADERAANIEAMRADIEWKAPYLGPCPVALLYDAGYRKQVEP